MMPPASAGPMITANLFIAASTQTNSTSLDRTASPPSQVFERQHQLGLRLLQQERHHDQRVEHHQPDQDREPAAHDPQIFLTRKDVQRAQRRRNAQPAAEAAIAHAAALTSVR